MSDLSKPSVKRDGSVHLGIFRIGLVRNIDAGLAGLPHLGGRVFQAFDKDGQNISSHSTRREAVAVIVHHWNVATGADSAGVYQGYTGCSLKDRRSKEIAMTDSKYLCTRCGQEAEARVHTMRPGSWSGHQFTGQHPQHTVDVRIPKRFYEDHVGRDLPAGTIVRELAKHLVVQLDHEAFAELLDDAVFYGEPETQRDMGPEYAGLCSSARATAAALLRVDTPWKAVS